MMQESAILAFLIIMIEKAFCEPNVNRYKHVFHSPAMSIRQVIRPSPVVLFPSTV